MSIIQEFKQFALKGNVVDLAVGVIMGAAFGKIVNSLVADVLMPPIGYLVGGIKFSDLSYKLPAMTVGGKTLEPVEIKYGSFLQTSFDFLIVALCVFALVKAMNTLMRKTPPPPAAPPEDIKLLTEIRDALRSRA